MSEAFDPGTGPAGERDAERAERLRLMFARPWVFKTGCASLDALPPVEGVEVAFAGRSNVGKSSLINAVLGQNGLARTSNTPGRTQMLNFFVPGMLDTSSLKKERATTGAPREGHDGTPVALVDMPGYGFAQAPEKDVKAWTHLVFDYLRGRPNLRRVYVLIDARHGLKPNDKEALDLLDKAAVSYQVVLTKADKLAKEPEAKAIGAVVQATAAAILKRPAAHPVVLVTSSDKGWGIEAIRAEIADFSL